MLKLGPHDIKVLRKDLKVSNLELSDQIDKPTSRFLADGAYDGPQTSGLHQDCFGKVVEIITPPPKNAAQQWKKIIGPKLNARCFENQQIEVKTDIAFFNKMTVLGRPVFEQIA